MIRQEITTYIEENIIPLYDHFDRGHRRDHAYQVMERSAHLARCFDVDEEMVYIVAAYHDTGLCNGRELHHKDSARILLADAMLRRWFSEEQIRTMADAAEDHRASAESAPRTIYGRIVADRLIIPELIVRRTVQYSIANFPALDYEGHWRRSLEHLEEKYAEGGYLRLWIEREENDNAKRLKELRSIIADKERLREIFDKIFTEETNKKE